MMLLAAVFIAGKIGAALFAGQSPIHQELGAGLVLIAAAFVLNGIMGIFLWNSGRRHRSLTLVADGKHLFSDAVSSAVVLVALILVRWTGLKWIDTAGRRAGGGLYRDQALGLMRQSAAGLMDEQDVADQPAIAEDSRQPCGPERHGTADLQLSQGSPSAQRAMDLGGFPHHGPGVVGCAARA